MQTIVWQTLMIEVPSGCENIYILVDYLETVERRV